MSKALSLFYPNILPRVLGCPNPLVDQALVYAAGVFCRNTGAVQDTTTQNVVAGQADYDLDVPTGMLLSNVIDVYYLGNLLGAVGTQWAQKATALRGSVGSELPDTGTPQAYFQKDASVATISLYPTPDTSGTATLTVRANYEPMTSATTLPDVLYDYHLVDICNGAIAYLMSLPGESFSNHGLGKEYELRFHSAINAAKNTSQQGRLYQTLRVQGRRFA